MKSLKNVTGVSCLNYFASYGWDGMMSGEGFKVSYAGGKWMAYRKKKKIGHGMILTEAE